MLCLYPSKEGSGDGGVLEYPRKWCGVLVSQQGRVVVVVEC